MAFSLPPLAANPAGWGPPSTIQSDLLPSFLKDLPLQPFSKGDRISKAADWTSTTRSVVGRREYQGTVTGFTFTIEEEDDSEFRLVDSRPSSRSKLGRFRGRGGLRPTSNFRPMGSSYVNQRPGSSQRGRGQQAARGQQRTRGQQRNFQPYGQRRYNNDNRRFDVSISVNPEWGDPIDIWEFSKVNKLKETTNFPHDSPELFTCGRIGYFNPDFSKNITPKQEKTLARNFATERTFLKVTTSEDPNMKKFASEQVGNVFMTDSILATLLAMSRSVYSWDLVVTKQNGQLWFDKRTSKFDAITVNENATDVPDNNDPEPLNTPNKLSAEAIAVQHNFSQQVLIKDKFYSFPFTTPFSTENNSATLAPVGYVYRQMEVSEELTLVVRAEIDAAKQSKSDDVEFVSVKTLNEYDAKVTGDWRKKLEIQRGGVLASELKNNMFKIQKWAIQAVIAGCSSIEIGFVSRQQPKDNAIHSILTLQSYTPQDFINQMNINLDQMWSSLRMILERIWAEEDGKYLIFKDPATPNVKLYKVPQSAISLEDSRAEVSVTAGGLQVLK